MRHVNRPAFDPGATYEVARAFLFNGKTLEPGDVFHSDERRTRALYSIGKLRQRPVNRCSIIPRSGGWYDVLDPDGKKINSSPVRRKRAQEIADAHPS